MAGASLRTVFQNGGTALGAWCFLPGEVQAQAYSSMGYDYVGVDLQHGLIDDDMGLRMIQAIDLGTACPLVRVPSNDPQIIGRMLDYGAMAIIVPMIETADDAKAAVLASRYAPEGQRSFGPIRAGLRDGASYFGSANENIFVIPMIETAAALRNLDDILAVDGIDAVYVGPFDLSISLGLPPRNNDGEEAFDDALVRVVDGCRQVGIIPAIHSDPKLATTRLEQGFRMVTCGIDFAAQYSGMAAALKAVRNGS